MRRLGLFLVAAALAAGCGSSSKNDGKGSSGGSSGNGGSGASGGSSGNGGSGASGGSAGNGSAGASGGSAGNGGSGASGGSSGGGGTAGAGGAVAMAQCSKPGDCTLHSDCCNCVALGPGEKAPACNVQNCKASACEALGITSSDLACAAGSCNAGVDCDPAKVTCKQSPPSCAKGEIPSVRGTCWGPCVKATECSQLPDCSACDYNTGVCVTNDSTPQTIHCVDVPPECSSQHDCDCMANAVCISPYNFCVHSGGPNEILCGCPSC